MLKKIKETHFSSSSTTMRQAGTLARSFSNARTFLAWQLRLHSCSSTQRFFTTTPPQNLTDSPEKLTWLSGTATYEKPNYGGRDIALLADTSGAVGVFDSVGGWHVGNDFAKALLRQVQNLLSIKDHLKQGNSRSMCWGGPSCSTSPLYRHIECRLGFRGRRGTTERG